MQVLHAALLGDSVREAHALERASQALFIFVFFMSGAACGAVGRLFVGGRRAGEGEAGLRANTRAGSHTTYYFLFLFIFYFYF
jgi:hypothetical protein